MGASLPPRKQNRITPTAKSAPEMARFFFCPLTRSKTRYNARKHRASIKHPPTNKTRHARKFAHLRAEKIFFTFFQKTPPFSRFFPYRTERQTADRKRTARAQAQAKSGKSFYIVTYSTSQGCYLLRRLLSSVLGLADYPTDLGEC